jgi:hypothetical protein
MAMSITTRTEAFTARFEAINEEVIAIVRGCTEEQWRRATASEGWLVAVVAHHIAAVNGDFTRIVNRLAAGETFSPGTSMDAVHRSNAQHARDYANVGKQETLNLLRANGDAVTQGLRKLDDAGLDRIAGVFGGHELTVAQVMERVVIGHTTVHLASIHETLVS